MGKDGNKYGKRSGPSVKEDDVYKLERGRRFCVVSIVEEVLLKE